MWYGMRLQSLREQSGLTRAEVSSRTGISRSTLAKIEAGVNIPTNRAIHSPRELASLAAAKTAHGCRRHSYTGHGS